MPLSLVHVLAPARFGGLESVVHALAAGQVALGCNVTVVGSFAEDPQSHPFWSALCAVPGVHALPLVLGSRQYIAERRAIRNVIEEAHADVLHTHGYRPDVLASPVGRSSGVATVTTVHGFTGNGWRDRTYEWLQRRAFRRFDAVVAVSAKLAEDLLESGVPERVLELLPNAWAPSGEPLSRRAARAALNLPYATPVVGWVGRMSAEKAPDVAFEALAALEREDGHLAYIGDGPMRPELEARATVEGFADRIHWHGVVPGAARYLKAFDALAITSWTEGTPIVLLEAMAAGVPIVTTAVGGIPDVVSSNEAVLVEPGDALGIARALGPIFAGAPASLERAEAARTRVAQAYALEPWVRRYDQIYRSCLEG